MELIGNLGALQIFGILFALFALSRAILRYNDKSIKGNELFFWSIIWLGVIIIALFPSIFVTLSRLLGIGRGVDILLYLGMLLLFYLLFRFYVRMEAQQKEITALVREVALQNAKKKESKK